MCFFSRAPNKQCPPLAPHPTHTHTHTQLRQAIATSKSFNGWLMDGLHIILSSAKFYIEFVVLQLKFILGYLKAQLNLEVKFNCCNNICTLSIVEKLILGHNVTRNLGVQKCVNIYTMPFVYECFFVKGLNVAWNLGVKKCGNIYTMPFVYECFFLTGLNVAWNLGVQKCCITPNDFFLQLFEVASLVSIPRKI
jgi:hypothetical protein